MTFQARHLRCWPLELRYLRLQLTPEYMARSLAELLGPGDLIINLTWNIETLDIIAWCHDHGVLYIAHIG